MDSQRLLRLNGLLWLLLLVAGALVSLPVLLRWERSAALTLLDGKVSADIEHFLVQNHPWRDVSLNNWAALEFSLLGEGRPGVLVGADGWLYSREEFPLPSAYRRQLDGNVARVIDTVRALEARGLQVLVVPVPAKAEIYPAQVPAALQGRQVASTVMTAPLAAAGIRLLDTTAVLASARDAGTPVFFRGDTHWTPDGAAAVARAIALPLRAGGVSPLQQFRAEPLPAQQLAGDLDGFIPVRPLHAALLPPPEQFPAWRVESTQAALDEAALFGDATRPVALVGTSYSADGRWMFANWLRIELGCDVDNISEKARGPFAPMERFLQQLDAGQAPPQWVVWEIPVRAMFVNYSAARSHAPAFGLGVF